MVAAVPCGFAASVVARATPAGRRAAPPQSLRTAVYPGGASGSVLSLGRRAGLRAAVRARHVVTNGKNSSGSGPLDTVEIENCLQVRATPKRRRRDARVTRQCTTARGVWKPVPERTGRKNPRGMPRGDVCVTCFS